MRRTVPVLASFAAVALVATLAACSSGTASPTPTPSAAAASVDVCATKSGTASDAVKVTTDLATAPVATFDKGLTAKETERTVVVQGDGATLKAGGSATVAYVVYNATTGNQIDASGYDGTAVPTFTASADALMSGLAKSIGCITEGSRVVAVIPPTDAFGTAGNDTLKVAADDSLVVVIDVKSVIPDRANGADQPAPEGLPTVVLDKDGKPTVTLPKTEAPTELQLGVLKKGDGPVVAEGATVTVQYQGTAWDTGEVFDQSWGRAPSSFALSGVVPGFAQAIAGQTVGSQVIAVIPPALGYGEASASNTSELAGKTLVFVIDILATS